ncbi:MAG TPA: polymer-forming cytoskeletal protein [Azospirillum sp.]|nr:polymer-forming cytoskeletal protein [Azospirillum sp.]
MLFGRKNPPVGTPKPEGAATAAPEAATMEPPAAAPAIAPIAEPTGPAASPVPTLPQPPSVPPSTSTFRPPFSDKGPEMTTTPPKSPTAPTIPGSSFKPDVPRRVVDIPGAAPRGLAPTPAPAPVAAVPAPVAPVTDQRRLIVGRDISLSGEIGSCDILVVEGTVEAKLRDGRSIEITETGLFKGSVEIDEADIGGRFEGDLSVRGRLTVRSGGKITGSIKYGELAVEAGGQLIGDVQVLSASVPKTVSEPVAVLASAE